MTPTTLRRLVGALALLGLAGTALWWQVLRIEKDPSWPPPPSAVTADGAQAATEAFVAGQGRGPRDAALSFAPSVAADVDPWPEGREFFPRIVRDLAAAQRSIHILMFGWKDGEIGREVLEVLQERRRAGVEVRIVVDGLGSRPTGASSDLYDRLVAAGAQVVVNDTAALDRTGTLPDRSLVFPPRDLGRADHRKLYVVDGSVMWLGGAGIEDHFRDGRFHDVMARVTGDVVRQAQAAFLTTFHAHGGWLPGDPGALSDHFPVQPEPGSIPVVLAQVVPGGFVAASEAVLEQIRGARSTLDVMNPYLTEPVVLDALVDAATRGVQVRVVVSAASNNVLAQAALEHSYERLASAGVRVYEYPGAVVHAKLVVADDTVSIGTLNLDAWAMYRNGEIVLLAKDHDLAATMEERVFGPDVARSTTAQAPRGARRVITWMASRLSYFL